MLLTGGEHQKRLLEQGDRRLMRFSVLEIINLIFPENVYFSPRGSLPIVYSPGDVFYVLHNKVHRHSVVSKTWNYDIRINHCGENEVPERVFHKLVVLQQNTLNASASFSSVPLQPAAKSDIIIASDEHFVSHEVSDSRVVESHESFEQNDVGRVGVCGVWETFVLNKGVLGDGDSLVALFHLF